MDSNAQSFLLGDNQQCYETQDQDPLLNKGELQRSKFTDPNKYLDEVSLKLDLKELFAIVDFKMQNVLNAFKYPYMLVREIMHSNLQSEIYKGRYLIEVWGKVTADQYSTAEKIYFQKVSNSRPPSMSIYKQNAVYSIKQDEEYKINVIMFKESTGTVLFTFNDIFSQQGGCTSLFIDDDFVILGKQNQIIVYKTASVKRNDFEPFQRTSVDGNHLIFLTQNLGDNILDLGLFSAAKSYILASVVRNQGKELVYCKIFDDRKEKLSLQPLANFNIEYNDDSYTVAQIQAYDVFAHITQKGHLEIAKLNADNTLTKIVNTAFKIGQNKEESQGPKEKGLKRFTNAKVIYVTLFLEVGQETYIVPINKADQLESQVVLHRKQFLDCQLDDGGFNPLIFEKFHISRDYAFVLHKNVVCVKNLELSQWFFFGIPKPQDQVEPSYNVNSFNISPQFRNYRQNQVVLFFENSSPLHFQMNHECYLIKTPNSFQINEPMMYSFIQNKDASVFFLLKQKEKSNLYIVKDFVMTVFLEHIPENVTIVPYHLTDKDLYFMAFSPSKGSSFYNKSLSIKNDYELLGVSTYTNKTLNYVPPQVKMLNNSILIYGNNNFIEYEFDKKKATQLTQETQRREVTFIDVIGDRFIYLKNNLSAIQLVDLNQMRYLHQTERINAKYNVITIAFPILPDISIDYDIEKFALLTNRLQLKVYPFLHQPYINLSKMFKNPLDFLIVRIVQDEIFALSKDFQLYQWCIITSKLIKITDKRRDFEGFESFLVTHCNKLLCVEKNIKEEKRNQYRLFDIKVTLVLADIFPELTYYHYHKQIANVKFNQNNTLMIESLGKLLNLYEFDQQQSGWTLIRAIKEIQQFVHLSPNLEYYYAEVDRIKSIYRLIDGQKYLQIPEYIACNIKDIVFSDNQEITVVTNHFVVRQLKFQEKRFNEKNKYLHRYQSFDSVGQYLRTDILLQAKSAETLQIFARLNDFYEYAQRFRKQENFKSIFSVIDNFENGKSYITFPFTYYHWQIMQAIQNRSIDIKTLPLKLIYELLFVILPNGNSLFHICAENYQALIFLANNVIQEELLKNPIKNVGTNIPYVKNLEKTGAKNGQTSLDISIAKSDVRSADVFIQILKILKFDSHFEETQQSIPDLFKLELNSFTEYFDKRLFDVSTIGIDYQRCKLLVPKNSQFALSTTNLGEQNKEKINNEICGEEENEVPVKMLILDMPNAHKFGEVGTIIMEQLSETDNLDIFSNLAIRAIIEFKWPLVKKQLVLFLFLPYLFALVTFTYYSLWIFEYKMHAITQEDKEFYGFWSNLFIILNLLQSIYLFAHECKQIANKSTAYFSSPWNYIDLAPIFLIWIAVVFSTAVNNPKIARPIYAIAAFFMWIKFLYFLRIFRGTGYLISMIIEVVSDMRIFFAVFFVTVAAFGHCFFILALNNDDANNVFIKGSTDALTFTYRMALGDFATDQFGNADLWLVWTMFLMATVFLLIVMLNLLIAIISDTFERVQEQATNTMYKSMAELIFENEYLCLASQIKDFNNSAAPYLLITTAERDQDETGLAWEGKLKAIKSCITNNHIEQGEILSKLKKESQLQGEKIDNMLGKIEGQMNSMTKTLSTVQTRMDLYFKFGGARQVVSEFKEENKQQ